MLNIDHFPIISTKHLGFYPRSSVTTAGRFHKLASPFCDRISKQKSIKTFWGQHFIKSQWFFRLEPTLIPNAQVDSVHREGKILSFTLINLMPISSVWTPLVLLVFVEFHALLVSLRAKIKNKSKLDLNTWAILTLMLPQCF